MARMMRAKDPFRPVTASCAAAFPPWIEKRQVKSPSARTDSRNRVLFPRAPFVKITTSSKPSSRARRSEGMKLSWIVGSPPRKVTRRIPFAAARSSAENTGSVPMGRARPISVSWPDTQKTQRLLQ